MGERLGGEPRAKRRIISFLGIRERLLVGGELGLALLQAGLEIEDGSDQPAIAGGRFPDLLPVFVELDRRRLARGQGLQPIFEQIVSEQPLLLGAGVGDFLPDGVGLGVACLDALDLVLEVLERFLGRIAFLRPGGEHRLRFHDRLPVRIDCALELGDRGGEAIDFPPDPFLLPDGGASLISASLR